ncbi:MAG: universal stress protein [Candidatus Nitrosotalea sp.]|nr:universal stress protein [Candidatus Nitrosotalea sp.]
MREIMVYSSPFFILEINFSRFSSSILNQAKSGKYDVIIIGSRGQESPKSEYFGSIANGVLHDSSVSVLLVK